MTIGSTIGVAHNLQGKHPSYFCDQFSSLSVGGVINIESGKASWVSMTVVRNYDEA